MLLVALTGNIASGKSAVAAQLAALGAAVIDADVLAREVVAPGTAALDSIVARWGPTMRTADGSLDRAALRAIVFADAPEREALNAIVHPGVESLRRARIEAARHSGAEVVVCDIPLLFETGREGAFECIVVVDAPEAVRLGRLHENRGLSIDVARQMIAAQLPAGPKRARADYVIENGGSREALREAVDALWQSLHARATTSGA
ncbi:MAG: dephospho-CoA kinase [Gemmatimonadota bacterium]